MVDDLPPLPRLLHELDAALSTGIGRASLEVADPDRCTGHYAGELLSIEGRRIAARSLRSWCDVAERLRARLLVPEKLEGGLVRLTFERLDERELGLQSGAGAEKYDPGRPFSRINKAEDPSFVLDLREALQRVAPGPDARVLDLGTHVGTEVKLMTELCAPLGSAEFVCVDRNRPALEVASRTLAGLSTHFVEADINELPALGLGRFDLIVSIATLQSPSVDDRELLRHLVQERRRPGASLILGLPNCTYVDGEIQYGAKVRNFRQPEMGLLVKELAFYRRYLQQHRFRVFITGKHDVLVTALPAS